MNQEAGRFLTPVVHFYPCKHKQATVIFRLNYDEIQSVINRMILKPIGVKPLENLVTLLK